MGDRAQVAIYDRTIKINDFAEEVCVYLYTHWQGNELLDILKSALKRGKPRWNDGEYLTRIIFSEMIKDAIMEETGYGISTQSHGDIFRPIPVLYPEEGVIRWEFPNNIKRRHPEMTFEQFIDHNFDSE